MKKDVVSKKILKEIARDISTYMLGIDVKDDIEIIDSEFTRVERRDSDIVFKNGDDEIIHIEIQNGHHPKMHFRMLRYYSDILFEYQEFTVSQYLIYIGKEKCYMKKEIKRDKISYEYEIIDMKDIDCQKLLYNDNPASVALAILCDFQGKDSQMVVNTIIQRLQELTKNDQREYENYLEMVNILAPNRDLEKMVNKGAKMFKVNAKRTPFYMMGLEDGVQQGVLQGVQQGVLQGIQQGVLQGVQQGVQRGVQQGIKIEIINSIKDMLQIKFNVKDAIFLPFLQKINSVEKLRKVKEAVMEMATIREIEKFVKKMEN